MIKLYGNRFSPPSNKVEMCLNQLGIEYEFVFVDLLNGEQRKPEFLALTSFGKVPFLVDGNFKLSESNAIMKYLCRKAKSDLYPSGLEEQAEVDKWCDFISMHLAMAYGKVIFNKMIASKMGSEPDERSMKEGYEFLSKYFPLIEEKLNKTKFMAGDEMTIADILLVATIDPSEMIEVDLKAYPKLIALRNSLKSQSFYQKVHKVYGESMMMAK
jgi:glutathione S-transferase